MRRRSLRGPSLALLFVTGCSPQPLPDAGSPGAVTYAQQCGLCHPAHQPSLLTPAMWKVQMARMAEMRVRRGMPALTAGEEKLILEYLTSHAG